jgi:hypothetical protein
MWSNCRLSALCRLVFYYFVLLSSVSHLVAEVMILYLKGEALQVKNHYSEAIQKIDEGSDECV